MNKLTQEEFEKQVINKYHGKYSVIGKYIKCDVPIKLRCNSCGYVFERTPNNIPAKNRSICCPSCESNKVSNVVVQGVNDLWTTDPEIAQYLEDPQVGYKYRRGSTVETWFVCSDCGHKQFEKIWNVARHGFKCKCCGNMSYYPNQFLYNILNILGIVFKPEYCINPYLYRYDAYFVLNDKEYLIEMDGAYGHGCRDTSTRTIGEQIEIDNEKDRIAFENGYYLIRIDCKYKGKENRFEYIKNSILSSDLCKIINITDDIFNEANRIASIPKLKRVLELWNSGIRSYDKYREILHKDRHTISDMLKKCSEIGLIQLRYEDILKEMRISSNKKLAISKGMRVMCNETGEIYYSISEAERKTGITTIHAYFSKNRKYAGKLEDGTKLTWTKLDEANCA